MSHGPSPGIDPSLLDPGKQRRAASGIPIVPAFDGFRGIAIVGIVILHTLQNAGIFWGPEGGAFSRLIWAGDLGQTCLDALFIVSGFVMFLPVVSRGGDFGSVRAFAIRRAARLFPAYWLVLVLMLALIAVLSFDPPLAFPGFGDVALTFTTLEVPAELVRFQYFLGFGMNRAIWTLSLDITFYFLLVWFALRWFRRPFVGLAISAFVAVAWRVAFTNIEAISSFFGWHPSPTTINDLHLAAEIQFPFWAYSFGVGMTVAYLFVKLRERADREALMLRARNSQLAAVAVIAVLVVAVALIRPVSVHYSPLILLIYTSALGVFILGTILSPKRRQAPFVNEPVRWLGDISYGVYLIHLVITTCLARLFAMPHGTFLAAVEWLVIVVPLSILWGYLSARFLERPVRRWASRYARRLPKGAAGP